jgi:RND family efflux transporter MFP subunit
MNMHLSPQDPDVRAQLERDMADAQAEAERRQLERRRTLRYALVGLLAVAAFVGFLLWRVNAPKPSAPPSGPPVVSVIIPGTTLVADRVTAIGSISARRDMPVGVAGEGGMVSAIRAEAGQFVGRGQVLAEIDSAVQLAQLAQLEAGVVQARADLRLAQAELERAQALVSRGFISKADIDRRTATRDSNQARVSVAQAQVREMQERIARLAIRAPEAGLVLQRMVEPGQVVAPGSGALFRIAAGGQMELRAQVAEQDMPQLKVGQTATVTPVGSANSYAGNVWLLEPVIDPQTRQGTARVALPASPDIRAGGFANVAIDGVRAQRPVIPQSAVQTDATGSSVLVVLPDGTVQKRPVKVGTISAAGVAVTEGLTGTEQVVMSAGAFLTPGEKVKPAVRKPVAPAPASAG